MILTLFPELCDADVGMAGDRSSTRFLAEFQIICGCFFALLTGAGVPLTLREVLVSVEDGVNLTGENLNPSLSES